VSARASANAASAALTAGRPTPSRARRALALASICYLLASLILTIRLWPDPASRIVAGNPADADQIAWFTRYAADAISHLRLPALVTTGLNAPQGISLMWNPSSLFLGVVLAPVTLLAGPQTSLTVALTLGFAGSALAMFWVLRRWGCGAGAAFLAGAVYGFSPALVHSAINHYDLQFAIFLPLIADAALSLLTGRARGRREVLRWGAWLGLLCAVQLLTDEELLLDTALTLLILTVVLAASRPAMVRSRLRDTVTGLGAAAVAGAVVAGYPLLEQFFGALRQHGSPFTPDFFKNDLDGLVKPSSLEFVHSAATAAFAASYQGGAPEYLGYLGWPLLILLLVAAVTCWRLLAVRMATVAFVVLEVFALGGTLLLGGQDHSWLKLPWYWLQGLPLAGSILPDRFSILAVGAAAVVFAFAIDAAWRATAPARAHTEPGRADPVPRRRLTAARWGLALAVYVAMVPLIAVPLPVANVAGAPVGWTAAYRALRVPDGANVLTVPVPTSTLTEPMRWFADTGVPAAMVGGYFIGPAGNGQAYVGGDGPGPLADYLNRLWMEPGGAPPLTGAAGTNDIPVTGPVPSVHSAMEQIASWRLSAVLAVTSQDSPLSTYLTGLLGKPTVVTGDVLGWRLTGNQ
jgi:hypothetical protein